MRLFVAIQLPLQIKYILADLQQSLRSQTGKGRFVTLDNFHLTLKFLGEVSPNRVKDIVVALREAVIPHNHCSLLLRLGKVSCFGAGQPTRVVWIGFEGDLDRLRQLQKKIDSALAAVGFEPEERRFSPHITLAREVSHFDIRY